MNIIESIIERAKADKQRIVLPEGTEKGRFRQPISCCATALPRLSCWEIPVKLMHWQSNSNLKTFRKHESWTRSPTTKKRRIPTSWLNSEKRKG